MLEERSGQGAKRDTALATTVALFEVEQPRAFPTTAVDGGPLKTLPEIMLDRRATQRFSPRPVPKAYLDAILALGSQAPSAVNLQVWRYLVLQDAGSKARLRSVSMDQEKLTEAPVVIVALAAKREWENYQDCVYDETFRRGAFPPEARQIYAEMAKRSVDYFDPVGVGHAKRDDRRHIHDADRRGVWFSDRAA